LTSILHGRIGGVRGRGRPRRRWMDDMKDWTGLSVAEYVKRARERLAWTGVVVDHGLWPSAMKLVWRRRRRGAVIRQNCFVAPEKKPLFMLICPKPSAWSAQH